jgi:hypothetical protein
MAMESQTGSGLKTLLMRSAGVLIGIVSTHVPALVAAGKLWQQNSLRQNSLQNR